jgi:hypothetical protein
MQIADELQKIVNDSRSLSIKMNEENERAEEVVDDTKDQNNLLQKVIAVVS